MINNDVGIGGGCAAEEGKHCRATKQRKLHCVVVPDEAHGQLIMNRIKGWRMSHLWYALACVELMIRTVYLPYYSRDLLPMLCYLP